MSDQSTAEPLSLDAVVVGAGFSGLYALYRLRRLGLSVRVIERGSGIGGTWFWNRYPGARCDIDSVDYSYSFSEELLDEWRWTERFATQPEILRYLEYVADRFDLRGDIELGTEVRSAVFGEGENRWLIGTDRGETLSARWLVMCVGCLSQPQRPAIPGLDSFTGRWHHTAQWPQDGVDFSGRRVAVVGTGSTGIQAIPLIARQAEQLYVFQRTANYSMPAHNRPLDPEFVAQVRSGWPERRRIAQESDAGIPFPAPTEATFGVTAQERERMYEEGWQRGGINALSYAFTDYFTDPAANAAAAEFTRRKIRQLVRNPVTAELLSPRQHIGTKRTCVDTGYYETYNRANVELIDARATPITEITASGVRTTAAEFEVDEIVFAIGFDAITGGLTSIDLRGLGGETLRDHWAEGPRTYLGLCSHGFPNMFMVTGPGSPSVLSNMVVSIEQHVDWVTDLIAEATRRSIERVAASAGAERAWGDHVQAVAATTLYPVANSWYMGANIPGKPRVFMPYVGGCGPYRKRCDEVAAHGYEGFVLAGSDQGRPRATASA